MSTVGDLLLARDYLFRRAGATLAGAVVARLAPLLHWAPAAVSYCLSTP